MLDGSFLTAVSSDGWRLMIIWALVVGFLWAIVWYLVPYGMRIAKLRSACQALEKWPASGANRWTPPEAFRLGGRIPGLPNPLGQAWTSFIDAWRKSIESGSPNGPGTAHGSEYFTEEVILGAKSRAIPEALSGVFAGLGLLGTFIGIAVGLASIDITTGNPERLMEGVSGLMGGMSTAFTTSIYGIGFSLVWLLAFRAIRHQLHRDLTKFHARLSTVFPYEDPQYTLLRIAASNERVQASLQTLGADIAAAFEGAMTATVTPVLGAVSESMEGLARQLSEREFEGMEKIVENFRQTLTKSLDEDLSRFGDALHAAADHQAETSQQLEGLFDRLGAVSTAQTELLERTVSVSEVFGEGLTSLEAAQEAIGKVSSTAEEMMSSAAVFSEETRVQAEAYREATGGMQELLASQLDTTTEHVRGVFEFWESFEGRLDRMSKEMTESLAELTGLTAQKITEVFHAFDSEMATVVEHLAGTLSELRAATEDLPAASSMIAASIAELPSVFGDASENFKGLIAESKEATERTGSQLLRLSDEVSKATAQSTSDLARLSDELSKAAKRASETLAPLTETLPAIQTTSAELAEVFERTNGRLEALRAELEEVRIASAKRGFFNRGRG